MTNAVTDAVLKRWRSGRKTKMSPKGWIHGNAVCCHHNGETKDKRGRGGILVDNTTGGWVWHCFNCNFKTGYTPGKKLYHKTRRLLSWMGMSENEISQLVIEALRVRDLTPRIFEDDKEHVQVDFNERPLPKESMSFEQWIEWHELKDDKDYPQGLMDAVEYAADRLGDLSKMPELYYTLDREHAMNKRIIIPFIWNDKTVGFTARSFKKLIKPKYYMEVDSNYVFGIDRLVKDSEFVLLFEGPIDADRKSVV